MAMAARSERAATVRTRTHGDVAVAERALVKTTEPLPAGSTKALLTVVPRRRRTARLIAVVSVVLFGLMMAAAAFQTQLADRQVELDTLDRRIRTAQAAYDDLRRERAELRSPGRLAKEAEALGMVPARQTQFVSLDPDVLAAVQRAGAPEGNGEGPTIEEEFAEYAETKAQAGGSL